MPKPDEKPSYIPAKTFSTVLFDHLDLVVPTDIVGQAAARQASVDQLLANAPEGQLKKVLTTFLKQTNNDIAKTQTLVENWFDDSMTSLSEWYKTKTKIVLLGIGLATCVLMNADTINIVKVLSKNDQMRAAIVAQSQVIVSQEKLLEDKKQAIKELTAVELPIGYDFEHKPFAAALAEPWEKTHWWCLFGWLFSAGAVSLGAPFWFDMLNKLVSLKPGGKSDEKKKDTGNAGGGNAGGGNAGGGGNG